MAGIIAGRAVPLRGGACGKSGCAARRRTRRAGFAAAARYGGARVVFTHVRAGGPRRAGPFCSDVTGARASPRAGEAAHYAPHVSLQTHTACHSGGRYSVPTPATTGDVDETDRGSRRPRSRAGQRARRMHRGAGRRVRISSSPRLLLLPVLMRGSAPATDQPPRRRRRSCGASPGARAGSRTWRSVRRTPTRIDARRRATPNLSWPAATPRSARERTPPVRARGGSTGHRSVGLRAAAPPRRRNDRASRAARGGPPRSARPRSSQSAFHPTERLSDSSDRVLSFQ